MLNSLKYSGDFGIWSKDLPNQKKEDIKLMELNQMNSRDEFSGLNQ